MEYPAQKGRGREDVASEIGFDFGTREAISAEGLRCRAAAAEKHVHGWEAAMAEAEAAAKSATLAGIAPDPRFIFSDRQIPYDIQEKLARAGMSTMPLFCSLYTSDAADE